MLTLLSIYAAVHTYTCVHKTYARTIIDVRMTFQACLYITSETITKAGTICHEFGSVFSPQLSKYQ